MGFAAFKNFPFFVILMFSCSLVMLPPAWLAFEYNQFQTAEALVVVALINAAFSFAIGTLTATKHHVYSLRSQMGAALLAYLVLPFILASPIVFATDFIKYDEASFDMFGALTTSGVIFINSASRDMLPLLTYAALVAWGGAFMFILVSFSILEPLNLGGFEIAFEIGTNQSLRQTGGSSEASARLFHYAKTLFPPYLALTIILLILLYLSGERFVYSLIHATSIISTSGISPYANLSYSKMSWFGEFTMFIFLILPLSRHFLLDISQQRLPLINNRPVELKFAVKILIISIILIYLFVWLNWKTEEEFNFFNIINNLWGIIFTALSFLTTNGMVSEGFADILPIAQANMVSIILICLAMIGGGIATSAGGLKLLRIYSVFSLAERELSRTVDRHSVAAKGVGGRYLRRTGGVMAFAFIMFFLFGVAIGGMVLSFEGYHILDAILAAVAATANCLPVANLFDHNIHVLENSSVLSLLTMALLMVFGRIEVFVAIAVLNIDYWRY